MNPLWLATRSTGLVSLLLLTAVTVLGIITAGGWATRQWPRVVTQGLHRTVSLLTVAFLVLHIGTTILDGYAPVGWVDALVPFATPYKTLWLGFGTLAFDLILALIATSLLRTRLSAKSWKALHWTAYGAWALGTVHAIGAGTDKRLTWIIGVGGLVAVTGAVVARVSWPAGKLARGRVPALPTAMTRPPHDRHGGAHGAGHGGGHVTSTTAGQGGRGHARVVPGATTPPTRQAERSTQGASA